ncbi:cisplatin damage response ATP-dependent DNA ligase [Luteimonas fraxinea]|uniref:DNA ligase (ATP) n=1 Tax=Luteimonas fraxinea TaxID=2901869 RepID=A0ABS8UGI7_9GAMM|nr:cisplatin damage response ATP-dependent DNA ligase [Luteimonas fraxinea]MCD9097952.1 cisplatin damage response ATP-dependent DNA ligase [Luteimonas fraxinea]MCD9125481.1 cisplatin damage response ATP-dependent DNA ligase [Luteimonas fraxinea]UHH09316.1 cisplatin damage response ATP-dependent DNA ligase [Luteimonas fraxinea]
MKRFAQLYRELDQSTATLDKRAALIRYFREAPPRDAAWALYLLSGGKVASARKKIANTRELREWIAVESGTPDWLVDDSYDQVGDLGETLALLLGDPAEASPDVALADWIETKLLPVANKDVEIRRAVIVDAWRTLRFDERLLFNKLLTGALRVGVSQRLVQQALAELTGIDIARLAQRMLGSWAPTPDFLRDLLSPEELPGDRQQPYPFFLASPLESALRAEAGLPEAEPVEEGEPTVAPDIVALANDPDAVARALGPIEDWLLEWKWDGIRLQLLRRDGEVALWSRGEERLDGRFPEIEASAMSLPDGVVLDGELLAWRADDDAPLPFTALQTRIQRLKPGPKTLADTPVRLQVYDLLERDGEDWRARPQFERRAALETLITAHGDPRIVVSPRVDVADWSSAAQLREEARDRGVEGLMLKRASAQYQTGRRRGDWWKWKIDPLTIDAVLLYAQAGHGRRSTLYTDYTFGLWDGDTLVPVAKAYSGLDDSEILALDKWIRAHTLERFGPVRSVRAHHVFELGFEAVNVSKRHKSGIAVRFPRILRWRHDKPMAEADRLDTLKALAR